MTALSIIIPDTLAKDSSIISKKMQISRSQFIRLAIENQIKLFKLKQEQEDLLKGFKAVKQHVEYQKEMDDMEHLDNQLPDDGEAWWTN